jgi:hypothetical protein
METTLGELIDWFVVSLGESFVFWSEGALKIVTFDWLNLNIPELFITGLIIWLTNATFGQIKESWERHNQEAEEFNEAYNASPDSKTYKDMVMYFKYKRKSEFKDLPEAKMLKILKAEYRKKWKIELWFNQFFQITGFYWIALFLTIFVSLLTGKFQ